MRLKHFFIIITAISQFLHGMEQHRSRSTTSKATTLISLPSFQQLLAQVENNALPSWYQKASSGDSTQIITPNPQLTPIAAASNTQSLTQDKLLASYRAFPGEKGDVPIAKQPTIKPSKIFICDKCDKTYSTRTEWKRHNRNVHKKKPLACPNCPKKFTVNRSLTHHTALVTKCPCGCIGPICTKSLLLKHLTEVHGQKTGFLCKHCRTAFIKKEQFTHHACPKIVKKS